VPALAPLDEAAASWRPSEEALCKRLAALTHAAPPPLDGLGVTGLIARALAASTTVRGGAEPALRRIPAAAVAALMTRIRRTTRARAC
jgi:hypothetical protein